MLGLPQKYNLPEDEQNKLVLQKIIKQYLERNIVFSIKIIFILNVYFFTFLFLNFFDKPIFIRVYHPPTDKISMYYY